jgi:transglutaminase-like putative cysteine protease
MPWWLRSGHGGVTASPALVALRHRTAYRYDRPVVLGPQTVRLRPAPHARTPILSYALTVLFEPHTRHGHQDPQGNFLAASPSRKAGTW